MATAKRRPRHPRDTDDSRATARHAKTPESIARFIETAIANGVTVLSAGEVAEIVLDLVREHDAQRDEARA